MNYQTHDGMVPEPNMQAVRRPASLGTYGDPNPYAGMTACDAAPVSPIMGAVSSVAMGQHRAYALLDRLEEALARVTRQQGAVASAEARKEQQPQSELHAELLVIVDQGVAIERRIESILNRLTV